MSKRWVLVVLVVLAALAVTGRLLRLAKIGSWGLPSAPVEAEQPGQEPAPVERLAEPLSEEEERFKVLRLRMVEEQLASQARGIKDKKVLEVMGKVPRHKFVRKEYLRAAYADRPLPIGLGQTISQPYIVAFMTELLKPKPVHKVLEIGTGSGYQAAVLAEIVKEVYSIEIYKKLGDAAKKRLEKLGYKKVKCKVADGYFGWQEHAPFDAIIVTCAADHIPPPLIKQLKPGGRMCIPVGNVALTQQLLLVEKDKDGSVRSKSVLPVRFVPLIRKTK